MDAQRLVAMANQIALNFRLQPAEAAASSTASHLVAFWSPAMRKALVDYVKAGGGGLEPLARAAVEQLEGR